MTATDQQDAARAARRRTFLVATVGLAAVGVVFSAFVAYRMIGARGRMATADSETVDAIRQHLKKIKSNPDDALLNEKFHGHERRSRRKFLQAQYVMDTGTYLLVGGLVVAIVGAVTAAGLRNTMPRPGPATDGRGVDAVNAAFGRWATMGLVITVFASALALVVLSEPVATLKRVASQSGGQASRVGKNGAPAGIRPPKAPMPPNLPDPKDIARYWSQFRGPGGAATSAYANIPTEWDAPDDKGIRWKTPLPLEGKSSPVLWANRLFLAAADKKQRLVICFDADNGKELWRRAVTVSGPPASVPKIPDDTGYAPCTPATDGKHVVAMFPNGDLACMDTQGKQLWSKNLGLPDNGYGHGSSLAMWRDRTLVLFDQGGLTDGKSHLLAFASESGKMLWARPRPVASSWASPIVVHAAGKDQVIASADPWVISYDPLDGTEIWRAKCMTGDVASSPILAGGLVFAVHEGAELVAIRPDGTGDVTKTHVAWKGEEGLPDITSPVSNGKQIWLLTTNGDLTCYDVKSGKMLYLKELDEPFNSSPSIVGDQLWLMSLKGKTMIVAAGPEFKLLHTRKLGERIFASPVFADGRIYVRGHKTLYCIGAK